MGLYTQNLCLEICFQYSYAIPNCNCSDPSVNSNVNNVTFCTYDQDQECLHEQRNNFSLLSSNCVSYCPEPCDRPTYNYKISFSQCPSM